MDRRYWRFHGIPRNIEVGFEHLVWGFYRLDIAAREGWDILRFLSSYLAMKPGDIAFIIHSDAESGRTTMAVGEVDYLFYDDETLIWEDEVREGKVIYPFRVGFKYMILAHLDTALRFEQKYYLRGFGLGELSPQEASRLLEALKGSRIKVRVRVRERGSGDRIVAL